VDIGCHQRTPGDNNEHPLFEFRDGIFLAIRKSMNDICRHCDEAITGKRYRVVSEEAGVVLLNMVVCASCAAVAKSLLLHTEKITPGHRTPSAPVSDVSDQLLAQ
jgi:superfamily II helicase